MSNDTETNPSASSGQASQETKEVEVVQKETAEQAPEPEYVEYADFQKMDMRVGTIRFVEPVPDTDKLLRFLIDFGQDVATQTYTDDEGNEYPVRQIVSGIHEYYPEYEKLVGKQLLYIINLKPRTIRGVESQGMLMAVGNNDCIFLVPDRPVDSGSEVH